MERERKRRQMKTAGNEGKTSALQAIKLSFMNSGLISLKKGGTVPLQTWSRKSNSKFQLFSDCELDSEQG